MIEPEVDLLIVGRRFEEAARLTRDESTRRDLLELGLLWGRYALVKELRERLPGVVDDAAWVRFLYNRALPMVPWRRSGAVARVDRDVLGAIAADLGISLGAAATLAGQALADAKTRNLGKVHDLASIGGAADLVEAVHRAIAQRERYARATLDVRVRERLYSRGADHVELLQRGDTDEDDPKVAWLWRADRRGQPVVFKEHLAHPTNWSRLDGGNDEPGLLASVRHPNVVKVLERGGFEGNPSFVMDFVAGARPPTAAEGMAVGRDVASALTELHHRGIVVFDVKPDNVLWDGQRAVLIDLGFAQRVTAEEPVAATLQGSPRGVPPEVLRRWRGGKPVDVFQLGLALFTWLTGEHAFADPAVSDDEPDARLHYARAILHGAPRLDRLEPAHRALVGAMLDPWPDARPTASELFTHLLEHA